MHRNIMIISSDYTGHGHKSITQALVEQFSKYADVTVTVVDGYSLSGSLGLRIGKMYGPITRTSKDLWKLIWDISLKKPSMLVEIIQSSIEGKLLRVLKSVAPDAIVVTHPNYNSSVLNILEEKGIDIPLYAVVADPVSITPLWGDARACYTLCPTEEARSACLGYGVPENRIRVFGFPVRERFCRLAEENLKKPAYAADSTLQCLLMSGGEGSGNMSRIARSLLKELDCSIRIVCGRNRALKLRLDRTLSENFPGRVEIVGFTETIQQLMSQADVLITRASPNVVMEAVMCNVPLIITGALPGQEEGNPSFVERHNLGIVCADVKNLGKTVRRLLEDDARRLHEVKKSQLSYRDPFSAANIAHFILNS